MTTKQILQVDYREKSGQKIIQQVLRKIKPLASCPEGQVPLYKLERCIKALCNKYGYTFWLYADLESNNDLVIWRCSIANRKQQAPSDDSVFGCSVYEAIAKAVILIYARTRRTNK